MRRALSRILAAPQLTFASSGPLAASGARCASAAAQPALSEPSQVRQTPSPSPPHSASSESTSRHLLMFPAPAPPHPSSLPLQEVDTFHARDLDFHLVPSTAARTSLKGLKFGTVFSDHMLLAEHSVKDGWGRPAVRPFDYLPLHPAAQVLHYGMTCFEGMKAYLGADGAPRLFRPELNMARLARSAARLQLAPFDPAELLACIKALVKTDAAWLPPHDGHSLYIRPFLFSSASALGVAPATATTLSVVLSPVGPYFPSGLQPVSLYVEESAVRAWPGGVGSHKVGGNYAPTIQPQVRAAASHGAQQVVYTFHPGRYLSSLLSSASAWPGTSLSPENIVSSYDPDDAVFEECGAMNVFFLFKKKGGGLELATPPLDRGTILPGVTRDSILSLTREWGEFEVSERPITVREVRAAAAEGRLREVFGCGTACIVQPVNALVRGDGEAWRPAVSDPADPDALAPRLQRMLLNIQYGRVSGHPWSVRVD
jgi:branched-chain amino acid aminotransferase